MSRVCKDCGKEFDTKASVWVCSPCKYLRAKAKSDTVCDNCGASSTKSLCRSCWIESQTGERNSRFKGFYINSGGYRMVKRHGHANAQATGWILEHVFVMSEYLGRPLIDGENVHHINGDRLDNRLENLELWVTMQPTGQRVADRIKDAKRVLSIYGEDESLYRVGS